MFFNQFSYKGKTYVQCTADHSGNEAEWCATQVDGEGEVINKQWGDCDTKSLSCLTLGAGSIGQSRPAPPKSPKPSTPIIPKGWLPYPETVLSRFALFSN